MQALTQIESKRYENLKRQIKDWWKDRIRIGEALKEIQDSKLYRHEYGTFEGFCISEFGIKHSQAYRLIEAANVKESIKDSPVVGSLANEGQARALALVPPEKRAEVLEKASGEGAVTARAITEAAKSIAPEKPKEQLDKTSYPIPESIIDDWRRAQDTARHMLSAISNLRSELKTALNESDVIFAEVTNTTVADLDNAYTSIKCVTPYAVCTSCQGHNRKKCSLCKGRGFISEFAWRSFVPSEIKKMRGAKK